LYAYSNETARNTQSQHKSLTAVERLTLQFRDFKCWMKNHFFVIDRRKLYVCSNAIAKVQFFNPIWLEKEFGVFGSILSIFAMPL